MTRTITMGRIGTDWEEEFSPLFREDIEHQVRQVLRAYNSKCGDRFPHLALRSAQPVAAWQDGEVVVDEDPKRVGAIPVWVWWADV